MPPWSVEAPQSSEMRANYEFYLENTHSEWDIRVEYLGFIVILPGFSRSCVNVPTGMRL